MKPKSQKQLQLGETIKRAMSEIFLREDILTDPKNYITILEADVSPDAKNVKIFIDIFGNEKNQEKIVAELNKLAPHFRFKLAKKLTTRVVPEIVFMLDKTERKAMVLEELIEAEAKKFKK